MLPPEISRLLPVAGLALAACFVAALLVGAQDHSPAALLRAAVERDFSDPVQAILLGMRLPRALAAVAVGAGLAAAGLTMQALTRNPLADPGLTGVNAGAALAVVSGIWLAGPLPRAAVAALALAGAAAAALLVRALAGGGDATLRLPLAGAAFASLCMALVSLMVLLNPDARALYRFWMVGSLAQADLAALAALAPVIAAGLACALLAARGIEALALGEEMGAALGVGPGRILGLALLAVALTAGGSVALAGPVGFIGLIAPHLVRRMAPGAGLGGRLVLACPVGACLALVADAAGRRLPRPEEWPLSLMLAVLGAPVFIWLVRRMLRGEA